jgi:hypothetical protein
MPFMTHWAESKLACELYSLSYHHIEFNLFYRVEAHHDDDIPNFGDLEQVDMFIRRFEKWALRVILESELILSICVA